MNSVLAFIYLLIPAFFIAAIVLLIVMSNRLRQDESKWANLQVQVSQLREEIQTLRQAQDASPTPGQVAMSAAYAPATPAPVGSFIPAGAPYVQTPAPASTVRRSRRFFRRTAAASAANSSVESWFGTNVIGIVASVLVFLGLVFLGILVVPSMSDTQKMATMFLISAALTLTGGLLTRRHSTNFTLILFGCGFGAFFISIMLTHLFFHALTEISAFSLLILWMALCFLVVRWTQSILLSVICHVGMIVSLCFAFIGGVSDAKLLMLLCYQVASTVVICVGNIICCRRTYRFGLFA